MNLYFLLEELIQTNEMKIIRIQFNQDFCYNLIKKLNSTAILKLDFEEKDHIKP